MGSRFFSTISRYLNAGNISLTINWHRCPVTINVLRNIFFSPPKRRANSLCFSSEIIYRVRYKLRKYKNIIDISWYSFSHSAQLIILCNRQNKKIQTLRMRETKNINCRQFNHRTLYKHQWQSKWSRFDYFSSVLMIFWFWLLSIISVHCH